MNIYKKLVRQLNHKQAGHELDQAQDKPEVIVNDGVEVGVKVEAYHQ